jgi:beta-lactamase regulating signal transducer with metallopeptidase domain
VQEFLQSAFLQALAYSLIASIWQMALLWLITVALLRLFRFSSSEKFNIAFIAQLSGFCLFIFTCFYSYYTGVAKITFNREAGYFLFNLNIFIAEVMPYAAVIYLCILMFKLGRFIFVYNNTNALKKDDLKKISATHRIFVQQMSELFSLNRKVNIYLSEKILCPLTTGFLKPVILIPLAAVNHLTTEQTEAVILHELAHIKRADYLLYLVQSLIDKIFFFNIFSGLISNIIELERENACDDWVMQFKYNSMHYAEALFKLGRIKTLAALAMPLSGKKESVLLIRIRRLLHNTQNKNSFNLQSLLFGLFSVMIAAGLILSSFAKYTKQKIADTSKVTQDQKKNIQIADGKNPPVEIAFVNKVKTNPPVNELSIEKSSVAKARSGKKKNTEAELSVKLNPFVVNPNYLVQVNNSLDSLKNILPQYRQAFNSQPIITPSVLQKVISYQNFKRLENMLAASGNSIHITETDASKDSYRKQITIEAMDKSGNKHVYTVVVELYQ